MSASNVQNPPVIDPFADTMAPVKAVIPLARMPQQATVQTQEEDWTGITDRTERRKLQNRLNQRALRMRVTTSAPLSPWVL